jgi:aminoglycoside phosphotransferase (APT) family kinase protein
VTAATIDGARAPRAGEELDTTALAAWLADHVDGARGQPVDVQQFPGGHSNLTYLVTVGERELVLRRPPVGSKVKSAHDMGREVRVLSRLAPAWSPAPRPIASCEDPSVLGSPFYLMERKRGVILRRELPAGLAIDAEAARRLSALLVDGLAELHAIDYTAIGLGDLGKPDGYVERQVRGWTERYAGSRTDDIAAVDRVAGWLAANLPKSPAPALIHNDYKYDNIVLDADRLTSIVGVLDWEMATIGDPLMDLGTSLAYWVEAADPPGMIAMRFGPTTLPGMMTRGEMSARYAERTGRAVDHIVFYYAFGLFKTAVVAQQIYWRWKQGLTRDPRFEPFLLAVGALSQQASAAIDRGAL